MSHPALDSLPTIDPAELVTATGGAGFDLAGIASQIGGMVGGEKGQQMGAQAGGIINQIMGMVGGAGGGGA